MIIFTFPALRITLKAPEPRVPILSHQKTSCNRANYLWRFHAVVFVVVVVVVTADSPPQRARLHLFLATRGVARKYKLLSKGRSSSSVVLALGTLHLLMLSYCLLLILSVVIYIREKVPFPPLIHRQTSSLLD